MSDDKDLGELNNSNKSKNNELRSYDLSLQERHNKKGESFETGRLNLSPAVINNTNQLPPGTRFYQGYHPNIGVMVPISGTGVDFFNPETQTMKVTIYDTISGEEVKQVILGTENFITSVQQVPASEKNESSKSN